MADLHEIRLASHADLLQIESIELATNPTPWAKQALITSLDDPNQCYVLTRSNSVEAYLIGVVTIGEASLLHIVVSKTNQGQGLASLLLTFWLEYLRDLKTVDECWLEVRRSNTTAQLLYQKFGFKPVSVRKGYYVNRSVSGNSSREDALIYRFIVN